MYVSAIFIMESIMEHIAQSLGKTPIDVKKVNFYTNKQVATLQF